MLASFSPLIPYEEGSFNLNRALAGKSPETQRKYIDWLKLFYKDAIGIEIQNVEAVPIQPFIETITPATVEAWLGGYASRGHSKSGLGQARAAIIFMARTLVLAKQAPSSFWHDLKLVTLPDHAASAAYGESAGENTGARWLSPEEVKSLIKTARDNPNSPKGARDVSLIWLMVTLGLRRDEVAKLKWENLTRRGSKWVMRIHGKRNKWRAADVPGETIVALQPWARILTNGANALPSGYLLRRVFRSGKVSAQGITGNAVWRIVTDAWRQTGMIGDLAPHDLRRTAAAIALEAGATDREIQRMLGHSSIETTHRYLAPMKENTATYRIAEMIADDADAFFSVE
ncbi:MAG: site-specific integrase [Anaerolineae bacterium]|nr:site-specific integrase [Anaerolineae bacterium]